MLDPFIASFLSDSASAAAAFARDTAAHEVMTAMAAAISRSLDDGGKLLVAGNGGSAADAQHIAGEFVARLMYDRRPLAAIALSTDTSSMTATANDYGFAHVFERQVLALGRPGDVFLGISTSGRSPNILRALDAARDRGLVTLGFTGEAGMQPGEGGTDRCRLTLRAPSAWTPVIQQIHITAAHVVCALVERTLCPQDEAGVAPGA
jgi:D-sedoheptulose 7-phosphate isomerase